MEPTLVTETSQVKTQTPGKFPEKSTLESQHGESLKTYIREVLVSKMYLDRLKTVLL
jgi:hypothetical protein